MKQKILRAGVLSIGSLIATQIIRFLGNIVLAKLLAPEAFGLVGIVNLTILGINMMSDLGLRQVVIQRQKELTDEFLNTVWIIQIARGFIIFAIASMSAIGLTFIQANNWIAGNVYSNPLLPLLIIGAASSALFQGFESTKSITERRDLNLGKITTMTLGSQLLAMAIMIILAKSTGSPWALVAGAIATSILQCLFSHYLLPGNSNQLQFKVNIAKNIIKKSKWILLSSPITFLQSNIEVIILGGLVSATQLGNYMIAYLLANVIHQVASNLSGNIFFPGFSSAARNNSDSISHHYVKFQIASDAIIVTAAGLILAGGETMVSILFDHRYASAGSILTLLSIGLIGLRYHVIESFIHSTGNFRLGTYISVIRLASLSVGTFVGFHIGGLQGAAIGVGISWFSVWPIFIWSRNRFTKKIWGIESAAIVFLILGYGLGTLFTKVVEAIRY